LHEQTPITENQPQKGTKTRHISFASFVPFCG